MSGYLAAEPEANQPALRSERHLVIGGDQNYPPYEYLDSHGRPAGFNVDLTRAIAEVLDLDIEIRLGPWPDILQGLKNGQIDAIQGMFYSNARNEDFDFTQAHTINHCIAVVRMGEGQPPVNLDELRGKRIVVQEGDIMHDYAVANGLSDHLSVVDSQEEALKALAAGQYDCALVARMNTLYQIKKHGWTDLKIGPAPLLSPEYCYAVPNNQPILLAELAEGLHILDKTGEYQRIRQKWMGIYEDKSLPIATILRYSAMILLPLLLILASSILWLWALRKQVAARTAQLRQSEEKHRALYENAPLPYQSLDMNGCFLDVNPAWLHTLGYERDEVIGVWFGNFLQPDCIDEFKNSFSALISHGSGSGREFTMIHKDSHPIRVAYECRIGKTDDGQFRQAYSVFRNITEQRRAEEALRESERSLRSTLDGLSANIALLDDQGIILLVNKAWRDFAMENGIPAEQVSEGINYLQVCNQSASQDSGEADHFSEGIRAVISGKMNSYAQEYSYHAQNKDRWFSGKVTIFPGDGPRRVVVAHEDITELKHAVELLRQSEARHRTLVETIPDLIWLKDVDGVYLSCNSTFERFFGASEAEIVGRTDHDFINKKLADSFRDNDRKAMAANRPRINEEWLTFAENGYHGLFETIKTPMRDAVGHLIGVLGISRDITERQRAEETLRATNNLMEKTLASLNEAVFVVDSTTRTIVQCNRAAERLFGYKMEELIGQNTDIIHVDHKAYEKFASLSEPVLDERKAFRIEYQMKTKDGAIIDTENTVTAMNESIGWRGGVVSVVRDITKHKRAEEDRENLEKQLRQAQKMESVGRLAGGVAHDFNNMLSVILGYTDLALMKLPLDNPATKALKEVRLAAQRSADLTHQLLAFARKQTIAPKVLNLNETISSMLKMLSHMIGEDIELMWKPGDDMWPVKMDPAQIDQILANLVVNARDAIKDVGKVTIETGIAAFDDDYCAHHLGSTPGQYVLLTVSDNGSGMDKETQANIFEPFFTTKPQGEGTGLGLATIYGIIKQNRGTINVYSEPGEGTIFRIYIPRWVEAGAQPLAEGEIAALKTGTETILVVEDEAPLLSLATQLLQNLGYTVLAAGSPAEALEIARKHPAAIDLLLTDVIMPKMSGRDLSRELSGLRPNLKCVFMSGYTANIIANHGILDKGILFLQKPFTTNDLAKRLRQALDGDAIELAQAHAERLP